MTFRVPSVLIEPEARSAVVVERDRDEMDDSVDALHRLDERAHRGDVSRPGLDPRPIVGAEAAEHLLAGGFAPHDGNDPVAVGEERRHEMAADEATGAGDEDGRHTLVPLLAPSM